MSEVSCTYVSFGNTRDNKQQRQQQDRRKFEYSVKEYKVKEMFVKCSLEMNQRNAPPAYWAT